MVYPDELHFEHFRELFLKALEPFGVKTIGTFSAALTLQASEPTDIPVQLMSFTLHTNVGIRKYSMSIPHTKRINEFLPNEKEWRVMILHLDYLTEILTLRFPNTEKTELVLLPAA